MTDSLSALATKIKPFFLVSIFVVSNIANAIVFDQVTETQIVSAASKVAAEQGGRLGSPAVNDMNIIQSFPNFQIGAVVNFDNSATLKEFTCSQTPKSSSFECRVSYLLCPDEINEFPSTIETVVISGDVNLAVQSVDASESVAPSGSSDPCQP